MTKSNGVNYAMDSKSIKRRKSAISRLENQLVKGEKWVSKDMHRNVPLSSSDISRINRELFILKQRV